jgi:hypothetical protein
MRKSTIEYVKSHVSFTNLVIDLQMIHARGVKANNDHLKFNSDFKSYVTFETMTPNISLKKKKKTPVIIFLFGNNFKTFFYFQN